jgi:hypothetical protein
MRITIGLPASVIQAAKARAAERGESLEDLVIRAVPNEVSLAVTPEGKAGRVTLPLIARDATPAVLVTAEDIADASDAEDVERYAAQ